jgi:metal-responsive CopG/Arc/MetJ family transcriptional regulator
MFSAPESMVRNQRKSADDESYSRSAKIGSGGSSMTHLTIALEENLLENAQERARQQGTSVEEILRGYLQSYMGTRQDRQRESIDALLDLASKTHSRSGGRKWTRDELHER